MPDFDSPAERIMVALDFDDFDDGVKAIKELEGIPVVFKVGLQLGAFYGWQKLIDTVQETGARVFCDTKFKDIPHTVEKACRSITRHGPDFFNIMADNSIEAIQGAVTGAESAVADYGAIKPIVLGVTVLTSISDDDSKSIYGAGAEDKVVQFASMAQENGLDGVVCSPKEAKLLKVNSGTDKLLLVTPGIRPEWAAAGDQSRIMSPAQAVADGSDYLVIGRPITQPPKEIGSSRAAVEKIIEELS